MITKDIRLHNLLIFYILETIYNININAHKLVRDIWALKFSHVSINMG